MPISQLVRECLEHLWKVTADPSVPLDRLCLETLADELTSMSPRSRKFLKDNV